MTDKPHLEHPGEVETDQPTSFAKDSSKILADSDAHETDGDKHGANRSTKAAKSKREIMEELNRERFPWEE